MQLKPIEEQVVVLMGASSGIGRETALRFARKGAKVVVSARGEEGLDSLVEEIQAEGLSCAEDLAKVSIVGSGMQSAPGYAAKMFGTLAASGINIEMITTSDIRITCIVDRQRVDKAVRALHAAFELDGEQ